VKWSVLAILLLLMGCGRAPTTREGMAQCKLEPKAEAPLWDEVFLENCMEAKGFVRDDSLSINLNLQCADDVSAATEPACYRHDSVLGKLGF
jgi:hypothetical protein